MKKNIVFGIITVVITIIVTIGVYSTEFNVPNNERALIDSVTKYIHAFDEGKQFEPHFVMKTTVGSQMIVVFDDDNYDHFMGTVIFQRGLTGLYRPIQAEYGAGPVISQVTTSENLGEDEAVSTAYYAVDCPPEIKSFQITGAIYSEEENRYIPDSTIAYDVSKPTFIELCRVQGFGCLNLFDENGVKLSPELYLTTNEECPHPSIGSAELDIINFVCGFFLVVGAIIAAVFFRGNQRSELIPCEKAIEPSEWHKPIELILWGLVLSAINLNFLLLQYILPVISVLLLFQGFRSLRIKNKWFYVAYLMASVKLLGQMAYLCILMTPLNHSSSNSVFWGILLAGFHVTLFLVFRTAVRQVFQQVGRAPSRDPLFWAAVWTVLGTICAFTPMLAHSWTALIALVISYILILHSLYRIGIEMDYLEDRFFNKPEKISNKIIVPGYLVLCFLLAAVCGVVANHLPLQASEFSYPAASEARDVLVNLGFPEEILQEVSDEDVALLKDAIHVETASDILEFSPTQENSNSRLEATTVYIEQPNNSLYVFHYFQWLKGSAYWQDGISIDNRAETQELINAVLLYEQDNVMYSAKFPRLRNEVVTRQDSFFGPQDCKQITGAVSFPFGTKNQRGYLFYHIQEPADVMSDAAYFKYAHLSQPVQIPYTETERSMLMGKYSIKQHVSEFLLQAYRDAHGEG